MMAKLDSITGKTFDKLTVLRDEGGGTVYCRCECGTEKFFNKSNVKSGKATSCGCSRVGKFKSHIKDTTGQKFGMLTVIEELPRRRVKCICDCGTEKIINKPHLLNGDIKSCGCLQKNIANINKTPYLVENTNIARIKNTKANSRSKSGIRGVCWDARKEKWRASIGFKCQKIELGNFDEIELATVARKAAEEKYFLPVIKKWEATQKKLGDETK